MPNNATLQYSLQAAHDREWCALLDLSRATLAVDTLTSVPGFHPISLAEALDALKINFVHIHAALREIEEPG